MSCRAALALAERLERNAEIVLRRGPVERDARAGPFLQRRTIGSDRWCRRSRSPSVEVVVHADAGDVFPGMPSVSDLDLWGYRRSETSGRRVTAEVKVKVLKLGRPIVREHPFGAGARGPADLGLADTGRRDEGSEARVVRFEVICRSVNMAICQTARPIEQQVGRDGDAETAPHRAEP